MLELLRANQEIFYKQYWTFQWHSTTNSLTRGVTNIEAYFSMLVSYVKFSRDSLALISAFQDVHIFSLIIERGRRQFLCVVFLMH